MAISDRAATNPGRTVRGAATLAVDARSGRRGGVTREALAALALGAALVGGGCSDASHAPACGALGECPFGLFCSPDRTCVGADELPPPDVCVGSVPSVCFAAADAPTSPLVVSGAMDIDTDAIASCDQKSDKKAAFCVIAGAGVTFSAGAKLRAHGSRPLVVVSTTTIAVAAGAVIDVSTARGTLPGARGAGANPDGCGLGTTAPDGSGGGFGGSFGGRGGGGDLVQGATGGVAAAASAAPLALRGGCPGGDGASGGGAGGGGGGAVALIAARSVQVDGTINASGAGGRGGPAGRRGGGGGGSGGMVVIEAQTVAGAGQVFANGGGGGQGGTTAGGGAAGGDGGESTAPASAGLGGTSGGDGAAGGVGASGGKLNGGGGAGNAGPAGGGGGGGGAAGVVRSRLEVPSLSASPPISLPPGCLLLDPRHQGLCLSGGDTAVTSR